MRNQGKMGAPLEANIILYANDALYDRLKLLKNELRFIFITSGAQIKHLNERQENASATDREDLYIEVQRNSDPKCVRCWHHVADVDQNSEYPGLCGRCVENVNPHSKGEERYYA